MLRASLSVIGALAIVAATDPTACPVTMELQPSRPPESIIAGIISTDETASKAMLAAKPPIRTRPAAHCLIRPRTRPSSFWRNTPRPIGTWHNALAAPGRPYPLNGLWCLIPTPPRVSG